MAADAFGFIGMFFILFAFIMNQTHRWKDDHLVYDAFNLIGGSLMVAYAVLIDSYPFLALNSAWTIVSLRDVVLDLRKVAKEKKTHVGHKKR